MGIPTSFDKLGQLDPLPPDYFSVTSLDNSTTLTGYYNGVDIVLSTSFDREQWTEHVISQSNPTITYASNMPSGTTLYFKGDNDAISRYFFGISAGKTDLGGNFRSVFNSDLRGENVYTGNELFRDMSKDADTIRCFDVNLDCISEAPFLIFNNSNLETYGPHFSMKNTTSCDRTLGSNASTPNEKLTSFPKSFSLPNSNYCFGTFYHLHALTGLPDNFEFSDHVTSFERTFQRMLEFKKGSIN